MKKYLAICLLVFSLQNVFAADNIGDTLDSLAANSTSAEITIGYDPGALGLVITGGYGFGKFYRVEGTLFFKKFGATIDFMNFNVRIPVSKNGSVRLDLRAGLPIGICFPDLGPVFVLNPYLCLDIVFGDPDGNIRWTFGVKPGYALILDDDLKGFSIPIYAGIRF
jgi:hypothetical protein